MSFFFQICEMKNCNKCILFEGRLRRDLYMWFANVHEGPSLKCLVESGMLIMIIRSKLCNGIVSGRTPHWKIGNFVCKTVPVEHIIMLDVPSTKKYTKV